MVAVRVLRVRIGRLATTPPSISFTSLPAFTLLTLLGHGGLPDHRSR
jgi:hypothetical protein